MKSDVEAMIMEMLQSSLAKIAQERGIPLEGRPAVEVERGRREGQGDWATNVALQWAGTFGERPLEVARRIVSLLPENSLVERVEVAGPGFINFFLSSSWMAGTIEHILEGAEDYGRCNSGGGRRVQVEFVSANPTGPLHVGHGRGAAVGDICARILSFAGWDVEREYYINDAGLQMELLGKSTQSRYFELGGRPGEVPFPEDGYRGEYIFDLARQVLDSKGKRFLDVPPEESLPFFTDHAGRIILEGIRRTLENFGVKFDVWFSEKSLYDGVKIPRMLETLKKNGFAFDADGATWFKATAFSDDKDRVLIRSSGAPTYFASDIAYHKDKYDRGFDMVIDVWGADHHGYIPRMKAAVQALGRKEKDLQVLLIQFVNLHRGGHQVSMSTRSGEFVTLEEVIDEVGVNATRYFFAMRRSDSHLDFDLDLAKSTSTDNPVYYVQYAHARIHSIFREAVARGLSFPVHSEVDLSVLVEPEEIGLVKRLSAFPEEVEKAAADLAPHRIVFYAYGLAGDFHSFYNAHRILGVGPELEGARMLLAEAARIVLANALSLLGISAPEQM